MIYDSRTNQSTALPHSQSHDASLERCLHSANRPLDHLNACSPTRPQQPPALTTGAPSALGPPARLQIPSCSVQRLPSHLHSPPRPSPNPCHGSHKPAAADSELARRPRRLHPAQLCTATKLGLGGKGRKAPHWRRKWRPLPHHRAGQVYPISMGVCTGDSRRAEPSGAHHNGPHNLLWRALS